jgi:hypothetical protein
MAAAADSDGSDVELANNNEEPIHNMVLAQYEKVRRADMRELARHSDNQAGWAGSCAMSRKHCTSLAV